MFNLKKDKIVIFGIDSACWRYLKACLENQKTPVLGKIIKAGSCRTLISTVPPLSPVAWTTISTGVNPGKHGIFKWQIQTGFPPNVKSLARRDIRVRTFWELLSDRGIKSLIVNVPSSKPYPFNGVFISGFDTPTPNSQDFRIYPREMFIKHSELFRDYYVLPRNIGSLKNKPYKFLNELRKCENKRIEVTIKLARIYSFTLIFIVFNIVDLICHFFRSNEIIFKAYEIVDNLIGKFLGSFPEENLKKIILSDHGSMKVFKKINLGCILRDKGYIKFNKNLNVRLSKHEAFSIATKLFSKVGYDFDNSIALRIVRNILAKLIISDLRFRQLIHKIEPGIIECRSNIDWRKTNVWILSKYGLLKFKKRAIDYQNIKNELARVIDPSTGRKILKVYENSNIYEGELAEEGPDLIIEPSHNYSMEGSFLFESEWIKEVREKERIVGDHDRKGIFICSDPNFNNEKKYE